MCMHVLFIFFVCFSFLVVLLILHPFTSVSCLIAGSALFENIYECACVQL